MSSVALVQKYEDDILDSKHEVVEIALSDACYLRVVEFSTKFGEGFDIRKYFKNKTQDKFFPSQKGIYLTNEQWKLLMPAICRLVNFYPERPK